MQGSVLLHIIYTGDLTGIRLKRLSVLEKFSELQILDIEPITKLQFSAFMTAQNFRF